MCDPTKVNLVGGHINQIRILSEQVLQKKTSLNECIQYLLIYDDSKDAQGVEVKDEAASSNRYIKLPVFDEKQPNNQLVEI